jgi:hypothetical protein
MLDGRRNPPAVATLFPLLPPPSEEEGFPEFWLILFSIVFLYK